MLKKSNPVLFIILLASAVELSSHAETPADGKDLSVAISNDITSVTVTHKGKDFRIMREQDTEAVVDPRYAKTSRSCPPFCIQPMSIAPGVETIGEIEILDYLAKIHAGNNGILVIDSRTPDWSAKGTIPGAKNIPWTKLNPKLGATTEGIMKVMSEQFSVRLAKDIDTFDVDEAIVGGNISGVFNFNNAKTLVLFCNGMWCGQSPNNIKTLLKFGYPADKIKWYRGGMQTWSILGLSTAKP
jgi:rhodanese-related sulfurtransferase